jgi:uncharacterized protein (TIGR03435 family)
LPIVEKGKIMKTCEITVEAPQAYLLGVTEDDLKRRIMPIKKHLRVQKFSWGRKLGMATIATLVFAMPVGFAPHAHAQSPATASKSSSSFEVASIKPDHLDGHVTRFSVNADSLIASGVTLKRLILYAYNIKDFQLSGGPGWVNSESYEVQAKIDDSTVEALSKLSPSQRSEQHRLMIQSLLAERFKLKISRSSKEVPIYALVLVKSGPRFGQSAMTDNTQRGFRSNNGNLTAKGMGINQFAEWLSGVVGRKVVDKTDLQGTYDFSMSYNNRREGLTPPSPADAGGQELAPLPDSSEPTIFTALNEQLGLKLVPEKGPVEVFIIDSVEKPSEN